MLEHKSILNPRASRPQIIQVSLLLFAVVLMIAPHSVFAEDQQQQQVTEQPSAATEPVTGFEWPEFVNSFSSMAQERVQAYEDEEAAEGDEDDGVPGLIGIRPAYRHYFGNIREVFNYSAGLTFSGGLAFSATDQFSLDVEYAYLRTTDNWFVDEKSDAYTLSYALVYRTLALLGGGGRSAFGFEGGLGLHRSVFKARESIYSRARTLNLDQAGFRFGILMGMVHEELDGITLFGLRAHYYYGYPPRMLSNELPYRFDGWSLELSLDFQFWAQGGPCCCCLLPFML
jgi:hypothetical protein